MKATAMRFVTRHPFAELDDVRREMNGLLRSFDRALSNPSAAADAALPPFNLHEAEDAVILTAELPGLDPEAVEVSVKADEVTVRGAWPAVETPENGHWLRRERPRGEFSRTVRLPFTPPVDGVEAEFARGVLTLVLNKPAERQARRIEVKSR
ncbi:Hsp20/alpha crystallin family protein [Alienimonas californiensis]|nr:Hsp20/alpha crystallin family protein [Alienimonas californiensis]